MDASPTIPLPQHEATLAKVASEGFKRIEQLHLDSDIHTRNTLRRSKPEVRVLPTVVGSQSWPISNGHHRLHFSKSRTKSLFSAINTTWPRCSRCGEARRARFAPQRNGRCGWHFHGRAEPIRKIDAVPISVHFTMMRLHVDKSSQCNPSKCSSNSLSLIVVATDFCFEA
jgi:hypothetical protein